MKKPVHPYLSIAEIAVFSALFFIGIWTAGPYIGGSLILKLFFWVLILFSGYYMLWYSPKHLYHFSCMDLGFFTPWPCQHSQVTFKGDWPFYTAFTFIGGTGLILYSVLSAQISLIELNTEAILIKFSGYLVYGTVQAVIFFGFMLPRIRQAFSILLNRKSDRTLQFLVVLTVAVIFSLFHIPNPALMVCTFLAGLAWAWIFYRHPNILLMGLSHAILGTILHQIVNFTCVLAPFTTTRTCM